MSDHKDDMLSQFDERDLMMSLLETNINDLAFFIPSYTKGIANYLSFAKVDSDNQLVVDIESCTQTLTKNQSINTKILLVVK